MAVGIFALGVWVLASVPLGLLLGWACGLNKLSPRGGDVPLGDALVRSQNTIGATARHRFTAERRRSPLMDRPALDGGSD
jgi:hypothetical protein